MLYKNIEEPKVIPIPIWKWVLLFFCPVFTGYDDEGDIYCVCYAKMLFKCIYIVQVNYYDRATGNLIRAIKLTRKGYGDKND